MTDSDVSPPLIPMTQAEFQEAVRVQLIQLRRRRLIPAGLSDHLAVLLVEGLWLANIRPMHAAPDFPGPSAHTRFAQPH